MCLLFFKEALDPKLLVLIIHMISFHQHLLSLSLCSMSGCLHYSLLLFCFLSPDSVQSVSFSLFFGLFHMVDIFFLSVTIIEWSCQPFLYCTLSHTVSYLISKSWEKQSFFFETGSYISHTILKLNFILFSPSLFYSLHFPSFPLITFMLKIFLYWSSLNLWNQQHFLCPFSN